MCRKHLLVPTRTTNTSDCVSLLAYTEDTCLPGCTDIGLIGTGRVQYPPSPACFPAYPPADPTASLPACLPACLFWPSQLCCNRWESACWTSCLFWVNSPLLGWAGTPVLSWGKQEGNVDDLIDQWTRCLPYVTARFSRLEGTRSLSWS